MSCLSNFLALNVFHPSLEYMAAHAGAFAGVWRWLKTQTHPDGGFIVYDSFQFMYASPTMQPIVYVVWVGTSVTNVAVVP